MADQRSMGGAVTESTCQRQVTICHTSSSARIISMWQNARFGAGCVLVEPGKNGKKKNLFEAGRNGIGQRLYYA
jgi:hypothetical protein